MRRNYFVAGIIFLLSVSSSVYGTGHKMLDDYPSFCALSRDAEWMERLVWMDDGFQESGTVVSMHDAETSLFATIGSQLGIDRAGSVIFDGEIINGYLARRVVAIYNGRTATFSVLGDGYGVVLVSGSNEILYFKYNEKSGDRKWIYKAHIDGRGALESESKLASLASYTRLVPVDNRRVAFFDVARSQAYVYSAVSDNVTEIPSDHACAPVGFRKAANEWICRSLDVKRVFFLVDNDGRKTSEFDLGEHVVPIEYIPERDSLLYSRIESSRKSVREVLNLYEYDFVSQSRLQVGADMRISPQSMTRGCR